MDSVTLGDISPLEQRVLDRIDEAEWLELTTQMVRIGQPNSVNPLDPDLPSGQEEAIAMFVGGKLEAMGFEVTYYESQPRRPNVVGVIKGASDGPSLMFNDHLDTYPAVEYEKWDKTGQDPFNATRHGDWLYGRGTSDTRANLAASLLAVKAIIDEGVTLNGDLMCCYTVDEEKDGPHGSIYLTKSVGITADYSITAEPTAWGWDNENWGMNISTANSGHCLCELTLEGVKSHIWRPDTGVNAITLASEVVPVLNSMSFKHEPTELMGHTPPCICVVRINGGLPGEMQFSPDSCTLSLAVVGIVPGMTMESILGDIEAAISSHFSGRNDVHFSLRQMPGSLFVEATPAVGENEEPVATLSAVYQSILGEKPELNRKNAFNDTIRFREAKMNAVTFGPGEDGWAPVNEGISIPKSVAAMKIYAVTAMRILGVASEE
jgi:acetylornithine deacetylase